MVPTHNCTTASVHVRYDWGQIHYRVRRNHSSYNSVHPAQTRFLLRLTTVYLPPGGSRRLDIPYSTGVDAFQGLQWCMCLRWLFRVSRYRGYRCACGFGSRFSRLVVLDGMIGSCCWHWYVYCLCCSGCGLPCVDPVQRPV